MTQQRHSLYVLLATAMLLSGALAGLMLAREASGETYDRDGFVLADGAGLSGATGSAFNSATGAVTTTYLSQLQIVIYASPKRIQGNISHEFES